MIASLGHACNFCKLKTLKIEGLLVAFQCPYYIAISLLRQPSNPLFKDPVSATKQNGEEQTGHQNN